MEQTIIVKQKLTALDSQIITLIREGMFLEGDIRVPNVVNYLVIRNQGCADPSNEFYVWLAEIPDYDADEIEIDSSCSSTELIQYIIEFRSNPYQFIEMYAN